LCWLRPLPTNKFNQIQFTNLTNFSCCKGHISEVIVGPTTSLLISTWYANMETNSLVRLFSGPTIREALLLETYSGLDR
jgi:hypothetical protein